MFSEAEVSLLQSIVQRDLGTALWETLYMTFLPTILAFVIGLPLGILLVTGEENGIHPLPKALMKTLNVIINLDFLGRSIDISWEAGELTLDD